MKKIAMLTTALSILGLGVIGHARAETVKIAFIDPLSGPISGLAEQELNTLNFVLDMANREGWAGPGNTFEIVAFDGKSSPQESIQQLKNATDQGFRYILNGLNSAVALALIDAVSRYNERNTGKEVAFFNLTVAPEATNEKCNFWHFRFDSNTDMKSAGLASFLASDKSLTKIYLINQNYQLGQSVSRSVRESLKQSRPDIEIVGDDLHQLMQVKDFTPYISKIKASGAQAIATGNWGADLNLLVKAAKESGLKAPIVNFNAQGPGSPTALAAGNVDNLYNLVGWNPNDDISASKPLLARFKEKYGSEFSIFSIYNWARMFSQAIVNAKSTEPSAVAHALEGLKVKGINGEIEMRKDDHQIIQPLEITQWVKTNGKDVVYDLENTGYGFKTIDKVDPAASGLPSTCQMKRPA